MPHLGGCAPAPTRGVSRRFDKLLLCLGSRNRPLEVPGYDLRGIHHLRTITDVDGIRADLAAARQLVIVGAGYIGLEAAASARQLGLEVPERATWIRMALAELGRIQNHLLCVGAAALDLGAFTGFLSGMMGVGGGTIMVPAMVLLLGMPQHTAQGTSLLAMVPASLVGAHTHLRLGNVDQDLALGLVPGVLVGTFLGGELAHVLPEGALRLVFAAVLVWTGWRYARPGR